MLRLFSITVTLLSALVCVVNSGVLLVQCGAKKQKLVVTGQIHKSVICSRFQIADCAQYGLYFPSGKSVDGTVRRTVPQHMVLRKDGERQFSCFDCGGASAPQTCQLLPVSNGARALTMSNLSKEWSQETRRCQDIAYSGKTKMEWVHAGSIWRLAGSNYTQGPEDIPPQFMPDELRDDYTLGGQIRDSQLYIESDKSHGETVLTWSDETIRDYVNRVTARLLNVSYGSEETGVVMETFRKHRDQIRDGSGLVLGSIKPWLEAIALEAGARSVHTVEYADIRTTHPQLSSSHPEVLEELMHRRFDFAASYSSIEHDGLGRYGDSLDPFGDLKTMAKLSCLVKPGGLLFLGLPWGPDQVAWNAHRCRSPAIYNTPPAPAYITRKRTHIIHIRSLESYTVR